MARYIFYTQIKSTLMYSDRALDWILFASFIWATSAFFNYHTDTLVFLPFFMLVLYNIFLYKPTIKYWDMGGHKKIIVNMEKETIILDNKYTLRASSIDSISINLDERPRMIWLLGITGKYKRLVNGEIIFKLREGKNQTIAIQFKDKLLTLVELFKKLNIPCRINNKHFLDEGTPPTFWWTILLFALLASGVWTVIKFFLKLKESTQI